MIKRKTIIACLTLFLFGVFYSGIGAVALSEKVVQQLKDSGTFDEVIENIRLKRQAGMDQPLTKAPGPSLAASNQMVTHNVLVILIDFPDKPWTSGYDNADSADFDSLLFSEGHNPSGSMREFYIENSYSNYFIDGTVTKWYRAAFDHHYYDGYWDSNESANFDGGDLAREAVLAADADIQYNFFDNDGNDAVEAVIVIHAGTGYEESFISTEIHSHSNSFGGAGVAVDGIFVRAYTIQPEETFAGKTMNAIGVFCHEWGHVLGLPDLYDIDGSSAGIGDWGLMGSGNYNGSSQYPAHLTAWSKRQLGWLNYTNVDSNMTGVEIPAIEFNPVAYRLNQSGNPAGLEYWVVENRQLLGSDEGLPSTGLLIYHIDDGVSCNNNDCNSYDWNPRVFVEQADGSFNLQYDQNRGDGGDPYSLTGSASIFHDRTIPNSKYYDLSSSEVALWNISASDSVMTADFDVNFSRPFIAKQYVVFSDEVGGDGDFRFEAGEMIQVSLRMINYWADAENVTVTMTTDDTSLTILEDVVVFGDMATGVDSTNTQLPFEFMVPSELTPRYDSFFFEISANGGAYDTTFGVEVIIGNPQILIVADDDDNLDGYTDYLNRPFYDKRVPAMIWNTAIVGSPALTDLDDYHVVLWQTGDYRLEILNSADIAAMKGYLDGGGNLFLNGQGLAKQLSTQDPDFLNNYLKASYISDTTFGLIPIMHPTNGPITSELNMIGVNAVGSAANQTVFDHILPVGDGQAEWMVDTLLYPPGLPDDYGAVSYDGQDYKSVFFAFGFEAIMEGGGPFEYRDTVLQRIMDFFGEMSTDIGDYDGNNAALPARISLRQNYPNPFNPTTSISYVVTSGSGARIDRTRLEIFDVLGRKIKTLIDRYEAPGVYNVVWQGDNSDGQRVASGVYFYRLIRSDLRDTKKMILLK